jgi:2-polyprenyl-3-methyl-5-hydroxy-6-metoxy-1,4-benzoquinol methylase
MASSVEAVRDLYASDTEGVRPKFRATATEAKAYYARYVSFVDANAPCKPARILDVGCGGGWSTLMLHERGHRAEGLDLHTDALEVTDLAPELRYTQGDVQALPFEPDSFDVVSMYQVLEHVPDPRRALENAMRVLRPGGRLIVVGPNIIGSAVNLYWALRHTARCLSQGRLWEERTPELPRHPGGNTMPEAWVCTARHAAWTLKKLTAESDPVFHMREPDTRPPFHADNDACYFCNPMDLINWARSSGSAKPLRWWASDRRFARAIWPLTGGTWIVLEKS